MVVLARARDLFLRTVFRCARAVLRALDAAPVQPSTPMQPPASHVVSYTEEALRMRNEVAARAVQPPAPQPGPSPLKGSARYRIEAAKGRMVS